MEVKSKPAVITGPVHRLVAKRRYDIVKHEYGAFILNSSHMGEVMALNGMHTSDVTVSVFPMVAIISETN